ncbi:MAG: hypothetical protein LBE76_07660 [Nitrososphaerota archaeon]|nr:hypothetical protein [Nitrososphaerota archaeon]
MTYTIDEYVIIKNSDILFCSVEVTFHPIGSSDFHVYVDAWVRPGHSPLQWGGCAERW